ncbi:cornifelin homolog A-like [Alligator sinensis]|uniref:Cornifelin homolog A-like n=1 Tax=Alligator sinensis TaxID=38654 RepID=A0A3Q0HMF7_ALLSI|nr:cornifelin homolog A-like [Alligator sinensis]XP_025071643.1 cornifelin homolog A-like [Alligator sinensis]
MSQPAVTQQPGSVASSIMSPTGDWSTGRYDCCADCGICCLGLLCPTLLACYVSKKYGENCFLPCLFGSMTALRTHMRLSYGIQGTVCRDGLAMCFCGPCELCRMAREMDRHGQF